MAKKKPAKIQFVEWTSSKPTWTIQIDGLKYGYLTKVGDEWEYSGFPNDPSWDACVGAEIWGCDFDRAKKACIARIFEALRETGKKATELADEINESWKAMA